MPRLWNEAILIPLHKKGDRTMSSNYRDIALLDTAYKIVATVARNHIQK